MFHQRLMVEGASLVEAWTNQWPVSAALTPISPPFQVADFADEDDLGSCRRKALRAAGSSAICSHLKPGYTELEFDGLPQS